MYASYTEVRPELGVRFLPSRPRRLTGDLRASLCRQSLRASGATFATHRLRCRIFAVVMLAGFCDLARRDLRHHDRGPDNIVLTPFVHASSLPARSIYFY